MVGWIKIMIANSSKFHAILLSKNCSLTDRIPIKIKGHLSESETQVDLLGLKIDNCLSFKSHISAICKKAAKQLNALERLSSFLNILQSKHSHISWQTSITVQLCGIFVQLKTNTEWKKYKMHSLLCILILLFIIQ